MRKKDSTNLERKYKESIGSFDNRFQSAIGSDIPNAEKLEIEIFNDLDVKNFGISWWSSLPTSKRILIGDYLYQCVTGIEMNLVEAKLHYLEWLGAREKNNEIVIRLFMRNLPSTSPSEDLYRKLEELHICGFFRAIGSTLDCLGSSIVGVLGLPISLRKSDIGKAEKALQKIVDLGNQSSKLQIEFRIFFEKVKKASGVMDWLEWSDQYRNMYVHRGRRLIFHEVKSERTNLLNSKGMNLTSTRISTHLAKNPDRTDIEAFIKAKNITLQEDADDTISGIFKSSRDLCETICEKLVSIWQLRRENPTLLEQPHNQWDNKIRECKFNGYNSKVKKSNHDINAVNPIIGHRMQAASILDHQRNFWDDSDWS